jgi:predicted SAM-dependent methyltransferase
LPALFGKTVEIYGSDYNSETINWCEQNIPGIHFFLNELNPPLRHPDNKFDLVYCISVFTHLSAETGINWANELFRVLKPGGILVITTSGDNTYNTELLADEKKKYKETGIVVRGQYQEGKKMYLARHNPAYVKENLLKKFELLQYIPAGFPFIEQDCWIVRKR